MNSKDYQKQEKNEFANTLNHPTWWCYILQSLPEFVCRGYRSNHC